MTNKVKENAELLTPEEARPSSRLGKNAFYAAIHRGDIPSVRIGRKIFIPRARYERLLAGDVEPRAACKKKAARVNGTAERLKR